MNYLISVVVPVYNASNFITRCIDSILSQDYTNIQLILINDGSKDNSLEICKDYENKDERVLVYDQVNKGVSAARNQGIELATGDFICFVDSDDFIDKQYLSTFLSFDIDYNKTIILQDILRVKNNKSEKNCKFEDEFIEKDNFDKLLTKYKIFRFGYPFSKFYKSSILKEKKIRFNTNIHFSEDLLFFIEYLKYVDSVKLCSKALYNYVDVGNSLSYAYHSFESEIECYYEMIRATNSLKSKFLINDERYIQKSIGHFLTRSINSMYRPKYKKELEFRLNFLKKNKSEIDFNRLRLWNENNIIQKQMIKLIEKQNYKLADVYLNFFFMLRYKLEPIWVKSRGFLKSYIKN